MRMPSTKKARRTPDCYDPGSGLSTMDALSVQKLLLELIPHSLSCLRQNKATSLLYPSKYLRAPTGIFLTDDEPVVMVSIKMVTKTFRHKMIL